MTAPAAADVVRDATALADTWRARRGERQTRRHLERADFDALASIGFLLGAVPADQGGWWSGAASTARPLCETLRTLAAGDPSVTLVSAMHPAVLGYWLATDDPSQAAWTEQRRAVFATAAAGSQYGTITSEPGSGGDILRTRTRAVPLDDRHAEIPGAVYAITGDKHFGSGYGISDYMFTTAVADGEDAPSAFVLDMRPVHAGTSSAATVTGEWDGAGMAATQSHAARLEAMPGIRLAYDGPIDTLVFNAGPFVMTLFTAVLLGVFDEAIATARAQLAPKRETLRAYEQVEWSRADLEHWLAVQAYEGALRAIEAGDPFRALQAALRAKTATAELVEQALRRITQVLGGGTFSRRSPFASWFEDVRALGFLRPPWGLAFDNLFATSFD
ncbi:MAG TPA: acyl-CoA dehydrogenase family protein [Acidimicrobiia bacterium]|nr:acyl-CoA dehydrogenase family protein [Acidimicrobiia bacterium]